MKPTPEQIEHLYLFTRQHFVEHYDLQTELVDHLANGIEQQQSENPNLSFDEALDREFKKFGIFGFSDIVEKRSWALEKKYWKFIWKTFKSFFTIPKIILTTIFVFCVLQVLIEINHNQNDYIVLLFIAPLIVYMYKAYKNGKEYTKKTKSEGKKWMLEERILGYGSGVTLINLLAQIILNGRFIYISENIEIIYLLIMAVLITSFYILGYIIIYYIPKKAEQYLSEHYPEYKLN